MGKAPQKGRVETRLEMSKRRTSTPMGKAPQKGRELKLLDFLDLLLFRVLWEKLPERGES